MNQFMEMELALLQHHGIASMATEGRRMSNVMFPVKGSVKKKDVKMLLSGDMVCFTFFFFFPSSPFFMVCSLGFHNGVA